MQTFYLDTTVQIDVILDTPSPDSVKIWIEDPFRNLKVDGDDMTGLDDSAYQYLWQTTYGTDNEGTYKVIIKVTKSSKTSAMVKEFELKQITTQTL